MTESRHPSRLLEDIMSGGIVYLGATIATEFWLGNSNSGPREWFGVAIVATASVSLLARSRRLFTFLSLLVAGALMLANSGPTWLASGAVILGAGILGVIRWRQPERSDEEQQKVQASLEGLGSIGTKIDAWFTLLEVHSKYSHPLLAVLATGFIFWLGRR